MATEGADEPACVQPPVSSALFVKRGVRMLYWKGALQHRILRDRNHVRNHARLTLIMFVPDQSFKARVGASGRQVL